MLSVAVVIFSATSNSSVLSATATSRLNRFQELQIVLIERAGSGALDVERAQDLIVQDEGHRQRAARTGRPQQVQRVVRRVFAKIALAGGRHEPGDAVPLRAGVQLARLGLGDHPT